MQILNSLEDIGTSKVPFVLNEIMGPIRVVDDGRKLAVFFRKPTCNILILGMFVICLSRFLFEFPPLLLEEIAPEIFVLALFIIAISCFVLLKVVLSLIKYDFKIPYFCFDKEKKKNDITR